MRAPLVASALLIVLTAPVAALASGPAEDARDSPALVEAKGFYKEGKIAFEMGDYEDALELWKKAFRKIDDRPEFQTIRHTLVYDISEAHVRVYEVRRDITNLRKAKTLLEQYLANHRKLYGDDGDARTDRENTERRLAEISEMLEEAEAETPPAPDPGKKKPAKKKAAPGTNDPIANAKLARMREIQSDPVLYRKDKRYKNMVIAGSVLAGVGGLVVLGGASDNIAAVYATLGSGAVLLGGGIALLAVGASKGKKLREPRLAPTASIAPWGLVRPQSDGRARGRAGGVSFALEF